MMVIWIVNCLMFWIVMSFVMLNRYMVDVCMMW